MKNKIYNKFIKKFSRSYLIGGVFLAIFAITTLLAFNWHTSSAGNGKDTVSLYVNKGQSFTSIIDELADNLRNPFWFSLYGRWNNYDTKILAGTYELDPKKSIKKWYEQLTTGQTKRYKVSFIPGYSLKKLEQVICVPKYHLKCPKNIDWEKLKKNLKVTHASLEGQFLADTYVYDKNFPFEKLMQHAHNALWDYLNKEWPKRSTNIKKVQSPYAALILASIVEKETADAEERKIIAGVFANRLRKGMRLQSDPTVIYAMGDLYEKEPRIRYRHLRIDSKFNTYKYSGLPPTPIAIVSKEAINAVLHPEKTSALYFVAKGNGKHYFSKSLKEHNRAVRKYILKK